MDIIYEKPQKLNTLQQELEGKKIIAFQYFLIRKSGLMNKGFLNQLTID
ncbi:unnamed protein product [Paramecium sonneborni]|uniref:Uncharacterized protein n=1 Tax=Paramecium sonneborni TaxID=65129 RepID=A0A8S1KNI9_9CILI|nr:unnamed protein product [Paramecium sonneborni]